VLEDARYYDTLIDAMGFSMAHLSEIMVDERAAKLMSSVFLH